MARTPAQAPSEGVAAVERALTIVEALARCSDPITLADLSRATGFYKSTLLRLLATLEQAALAVRLQDGRYALGPYALRLGRAYDATHHLTETIQPLLQALVDQGTESASFHAYHDPSRRICLLRVDSHHSTLDHIRAGDLLPLDRGAAGNILTAYLGGQTPGKPPLVLVSMGERDPNCAAVASPVFGPGNDIAGALSLSGPKERYTPAALKKMSKLIQQAAIDATRALGGRWPG